MPFDARLTRELEHSAAPGAAAAVLERMFEHDGALAERLVEDPLLSSRLIAVLGASRSLAQLCATDPESLTVLADLDRRPALDPTNATALARWNQLEYLRIAARDLTGADSLETTTAALSALADDVLATAWRLALPSVEGIAVIGMGKFGASELNYASDVDVVFVGDGDARPLLDIARTCFRVDADLRPEGRDGPLVRSLASYEAYWDRWAQTWEFQALIKARAVTGPAPVGDAFIDAAITRVWGRPFGADELRDVRAMKARAEGEMRRRGLSEREVKRGRGGIRDIEFAVQLLQLVHGRLDPSLRGRATLPALAELASAGYVDRMDADRLAGAYGFLRRVEHMLQLVDGAQVHAVPTDHAALDRLARVLGYRDGPDTTASAAFLAALTGHQSQARAIHEHLFFRPLLELFAGAHVDLSPAAADARLAAFGFADAQRTRQALRELTHGLTRSSRMMQQLLPLLLGWLSEAPDPDGGLLGLRTLVGSPHRAEVVVPIFRDSPEAARRICLILGTSRSMAALLERHPDVLSELAPAPADDAEADPTTGMPARVEAALEWRAGTAARLAGLRRFKEAEELRIATADILGLLGDPRRDPRDDSRGDPRDDVDAVAARLTSLAEAVLSASLEARPDSPPLAVIGMGRFGGAELSYASDLDVLLVHDVTTPGDIAAAEAAAEELLRDVKGATPAERLFLLDADLRPEGRQGPLARSLASYESYYSRWAQIWERQALLRARPVAGDSLIGERFMTLARSVTDGGLDSNQEREIRRMKARIERERIPARDDPEFNLKLGRGSLSDVEWTVQLLQLRHGVTCAGTMAALDELETRGAIGEQDATVLADSYRFCERTRNRLYLVRGSPGDALPARSDQLAVLARSMGMHAVELRAAYRRVTRRAREVTERLFYGSSPPLTTTRRRWRES